MTSSGAARFCSPSFRLSIMVLLLVLTQGDAREHTTDPQVLSSSQATTGVTSDMSFPPIGNGTLSQWMGGKGVFMHLERQPSNSYQTTVTWVPQPPETSCNASTNCNEATDSSLPLTCTDGNCECKESLCWIYTIDTSGFFVKVIFTCGECGQLGSECEEDFNCDYPGFCSADGYCHCPDGEHQDDICYVHKGSVILQFLIGALVIFLFLVAMVVIYQTILSYRHHGMICWCRASFCWCGRRRDDRDPQVRQTGVHSSRRPTKSPAYTAQQMIFQNFNGEEKENVRRRSSSVSSGISRSTISTSPGSNFPDADKELQQQTQKASPAGIEAEFQAIRNYPEREPRAAAAASRAELEVSPGDENLSLYLEASSTSNDTSGMTEYFDSYTPTQRI